MMATDSSTKAPPETKNLLDNGGPGIMPRFHARPRAFRFWGPIGFVLLGAVAAGMFLSRRPPPAPPPPGRPGEAVPELVRIPPGTAIDDEAPEGWSHTVLRTRVFIESGDLHLLPPLARVTAERIRTAMLAEVGPDAEGYRLRRVGVGLTLIHHGRNLVVTPDSAGRLGVPLSIVDRFVLSRAEDAVERGRLAARTRTFALYDASVELAEGPRLQHHSRYMRHALLVDPETGRLRCLVWVMAERPAARVAPESLVEVTPGLAFRCGIHVQAFTIAGRVPYNWWFAMTAIPSGRAIPIPADFRDWSIREPRTHEESAEMERRLRAVLGDTCPAA
jgi:hypothetical protein